VDNIVDPLKNPPAPPPAAPRDDGPAVPPPPPPAISKYSTVPDPEDTSKPGVADEVKI
jgi:hypothetical protein